MKAFEPDRNAIRAFVNPPRWAHVKPVWCTKLWWQLVTLRCLWFSDMESYPTYFPSLPTETPVSWKEWFENPESWEYPMFTRMQWYFPWTGYLAQLRVYEVPRVLRSWVVVGVFNFTCLVCWVCLICLVSLFSSFISLVWLVCVVCFFLLRRLLRLVDYY
jgi:hypothetical protein